MKEARELYLSRLSLVNFKNYQELDLDLSDKINCFVGQNGIGKTNLLDAIYYLSFCKSFLNPLDTNNINYDSDLFVIQGKYSRDGEEEKIQVGVKRGSKKLVKRNKKDYSKLADHIGFCPLVVVSPLDTNLVTGGSEDRRKFIDGVISQFDKSYLDRLIKYNKILQQRNKLLKEFNKTGRFDEETLSVFSDQLVILGTKIYNARKLFIEELIPVFQQYYEFISGDREKVHLDYKSQLQEADFEKLMSTALQKDRILQYTSVGIHKDDLIFTLQGHPMKKVGSQGQQKTYLLSLKFAQYEYIKKINGLRPILLLDDVFDKLDSFRVEQIVKLVSDKEYGQIFFTDTNKKRLTHILEKIQISNKIFHIVSNGFEESSI
ncbi:MAG: DNA replication and repair protein RecF [Marinilabiliales bacterium]|nr:MAG: DNA replication and repair protein RecF [Marinilabiliales bacterium]